MKMYHCVLSGLSWNTAQGLVLTCAHSLPVTLNSQHLSSRIYKEQCKRQKCQHDKEVCKQIQRECFLQTAEAESCKGSGTHRVTHKKVV